MFNEAFWFFYWVAVVSVATELFAIFGGLTTVASLIFNYGYRVEDEESWGRAAKVLPIIATVFILTAIFLPSERALYAGAGQYIAESTEIDETLLSLKDILDDKIAELSYRPK